MKHWPLPPCGTRHATHAALEVGLPVALAVKVPLVVLSVDTPEESEAALKKHNFKFPLLSVGAEVLQAYNLVNPVNRKDKAAIAHPAVFVIDSKGRLSYAFAEKNYKNRAPTGDVIHAIKSLQR